MRSLPDSPFHIAIEQSISNDPNTAAKHFDLFILGESKRFPIAAVYTELNAFDINPDRWYCNLFAYTDYGGHDDYDWLSDWQSEDFDDYEIKGLEALQAAFANPAFQTAAYRDTSYIASLLIVIKFQLFISTAAKSMQHLKFPLLVTAHDFNFIAELRIS